MKYCDGCGGIAGQRKKLRDPRRSKNDEKAYVELYFCSATCEEAIVDHLERQARCARLVN